MSLTYNIKTLPNSPTKDNLSVTEFGMNIHLSNISTPTVAPVTCTHTTEEKLPDGKTMESTHVATLPIPGMSKKAKIIQIYPTMKTAPLICLEVLCYDGCTNTRDK